MQKTCLQPDIRALEQKISFLGQKPTQEVLVSTVGAAAAVIWVLLKAARYRNVSTCGESYTALYIQTKVCVTPCLFSLLGCILPLEYTSASMERSQGLYCACPVHFLKLLFESTPNCTLGKSHQRDVSLFYGSAQLPDAFFLCP